MSTEKHHYQKVYKSDHLGQADLEDLIEKGKPLIFTVKETKQEINIMVAGKKGDHNIVYFNEKIKPWVINKTNGKQLKIFSGSPFVEDWKNITIELYIDPTVKLKGETCGGIRIKPLQPRPAKEKLVFTTANFQKAYEVKATMDMIKQSYSITAEIEAQYLKYNGNTTA